MKRRLFFSNSLTFLTGLFIANVSDEIESVKKDLEKQGYKNISVSPNSYGKGYMIRGEK